MLVRTYSKFAKNNQLFHRLHIISLLLITLISAYQLLEFNRIIFSLGFVCIVPSIVLLSKSSTYKRKYLN
ncbi:membrane protein (plasmid) [Moritella viscosa]|nr:membrane protein [Moritella viscosa]